MNTPTPARAEFEAWCDRQYGNQAYLHKSATCGEWDAWQAACRRTNEPADTGDWGDKTALADSPQCPPDSPQLSGDSPQCSDSSPQSTGYCQMGPEYHAEAMIAAREVAFGVAAHPAEPALPDADVQDADHIEKPTARDILGAVARGWTHGPNQHKEMDADLAVAIAAEIAAIIDGVQGGENDRG